LETKINGHRHDGKTFRARTNGDDLVRALKWVLTEGIFAQVRLHGNVKWTPVALVRLAMFWVWSPESALVEAAKAAIAQVAKLFGAVAVQSYQALTEALIRYSPQLLPKVWARMHQLMPECHEAGWRVGLWLALGVDGSRVGVPRTRKNEERFCKPVKRRRKKARSRKRGRHARQLRHDRPRSKSHYDPQPVGPQLWLTLMWHIGLRLPWCWKVGPSYASERGHLQALLQEQPFPEKPLFCGDAGFVGFDLWRNILDHGHQFLIRVGSNVRLLRRLGFVRESDGIVYYWPHAAMVKKHRPLVLRLFRFHDGRSDVFLVTSIISATALTAAQASIIYRSRWGIELQFRSLKQTYGRTKLRSRTPEHAEIELHWSLVGLALLQLLALKEQSCAGAPPGKTSIAEVLRVVRSLIAEPSAPRSARDALHQRLRRATTDTYQRRGKKKSRNYPRRKEEPCTGKPTIDRATAQHKQTLKAIMSYTQAA
jgi:hypothetical protein